MATARRKKEEIRDTEPATDSRATNEQVVPGAQHCPSVSDDVVLDELLAKHSALFRAA